jgi:hypothetical protein
VNDPIFSPLSFRLNQPGPTAAAEATAPQGEDVPEGGPAGWKEILVTGVLAALPCLLGNLDAVTPIQTIFFLMMYATVNLACFFLAVMKQPGFR